MRVVCGLDPGTSTLGVAFLYINDEEWVVDIRSHTLDAGQLSRYDSLCEVPSAKIGYQDRIRYLSTALLILFNRHRPFMVGIETPFMNPSRPGAFVPLLTQKLSLIDVMNNRYDGPLTIIEQSPMRLKKHFGVSAKGSQAKKEAMKEAVLSHGAIKHLIAHRAEELSEHEIDAIAAALTSYEIG